MQRQRQKAAGPRLGMLLVGRRVHVVLLVGRQPTLPAHPHPLPSTLPHTYVVNAPDGPTGPLC
mgnify:CR=1 FL=1